MTFIEALELLHQTDTAGRDPFRCLLATGFSPIELKVFLAAHLKTRLGGRAATVETGLYGDLIGTVERLSQEQTGSPMQALFVAIEWPDLDARLGHRSLGSWPSGDFSDIVRSSQAALSRLAAAISGAQGLQIAVSLPTLATAPLFQESPEQAGRFHWQLTAAVAQFAERISATATVLHPDAVAAASPEARRQDLRRELAIGIPYQTPHAEALAKLLAAAATPEAPKKGLITDLDDTMWRGILGEEGAKGVWWDLDHRAQLHGLYQKTVASLAGAGVLTAIASKNDLAQVRQALQRPDFLASADSLYPIEANWGPKSESVRRILQAWNIGATDVVFIDDSPIELAEVARAHPGIETFLFPKDDPAGAIELIRTLRRRFSRKQISPEDQIRAASLQSAAPPIETSSIEEFLSDAKAVLTFDPSSPPADDRALELVNKTNQFNLHGRRYSAADWTARWRRPGAFVVVVSYEDRYGPLGRIAVVSGTRQGDGARVDTWVMSCRAFSRRIEHRCLEYLFDSLAVDSLTFQFEPTERNRPLREFFGSLLGREPDSAFALTRTQFEAACPALYHRTEVLAHA